MTPKDRQLIDLLRANARESVSSLARKLHVARTTVQERLRRLEESGTIAGYTVRLGQTPGRPALTAHVLLKVNAKKLDGVIRELRGIAAIRGVYALSGSFDYLAIAETASPHEIDEVVDRIGRVEGVEKTETSLVLSIKFERP